MTDHLTVADDGATRTITLHRPEKKNALTQGMYLAMSEAINSAQDDAAIRCLLVTGCPGMFTAGNDLEDFLKAGTADPGKPRESNAIKLLHALANNAKPLVAAVDGIAVGVGTTMLFHCDYVLASTAATFTTPFIHLGLVPEAASSLLIPRVIGHQRAFATLVMGRRLTARDAREAGFVNDVVEPDQLAAEARKVAREICALPAEAVAISRKLIRMQPEVMIERMNLESKLFGERLRSEEAVNAFRNFLARKKG